MGKNLYPTRNSLPEKTRIEIIALFTQISRGTDTNLWFVEAHEQAEQ